MVRTCVAAGCAGEYYVLVEPAEKKWYEHLWLLAALVNIMLLELYAIATHVRRRFATIRFSHAATDDKQIQRCAPFVALTVVSFVLLWEVIRQQPTRHIAVCARGLHFRADRLKRLARNASSTIYHRRDS